MLPLSMISALSYAQFIDDWEARPHITVEYKFNKNLVVAGTYYMYLDKNISTYDKSSVAGELGYKVTKWLKAGFEYRHEIKNKMNNNELRYSLTLDHKLLPRFKIKYRPMWQQEFVSLGKLSVYPMENFMRNRVTLEYKLTDRVDLFLFTENYQRINQGEWSFHKQKSAAGAKLDVNDRNELSASLYMINNSKGKNVARVDIGYTISLGYSKKK